MANAGRVAIVPKGDYSSSTAYNRLDLVRYNEKAYVAKKANTGVAPTNTEYWMLMTSDGITIDATLSDTSTNPVQNKVVKTALDNIQTTSARTFSLNGGWYRIAYRDGNSQIYNNSCFIELKKTSSVSESHLIRLEATNSGARFDIVSSKVDNVASQHMRNIRYTYDSTKTYIEVYISSGGAYGFTATLFDVVASDGQAWKKLNFEATSETVDGVTVTTTYDIPANASPVTDLDIVKRMGNVPVNTSILALAESLKGSNGVYHYYLNGGSYTGGDLGNANHIYDNATILVRYDGLTVILWGNELVKNIAINYYNSSKWSGWNTFATTADLATALAGYFPLDGSKALTGSIRQTVGSGAASYRMINNNRDIELFMGAGGEFHLTDNTHNNHIIYSDKDGKTTANLTATGNIARSSTTVQMINSTNAGGLSLNNLNGDGLTVLRFHDNGTQMGMLGFNGSNNPVYRTNDGSGEYKLIHSGNYSSYALPLTGGTVNISGNMDFYKASDVVIGVRNTTSGGTTSYISMQAAGAPNNVYIGNNNGNAYVVAADGYGYILHTANYTDYTIAKNGGGEINGYTQIKHNHDIPLAVQNTNASQDTVYVGFADATDTLIGWIGYNGKQLTTYDRVSNANKEIHHDGNSAKVAIQESAPTDTTALWVDTANNKVKAYKDGAWTAMA